jgi:hypothetical protein
VELLDSLGFIGLAWLEGRNVAEEVFRYSIVLEKIAANGPVFDGNP